MLPRALGTVLPVDMPRAQFRRAITSDYGWRLDPKWKIIPRKHRGIDVGLPVGVPVRAAKAGRARVGSDAERGNYVLIDHPDGTTTESYHLSATSVSRGQQVEEGQILGRSGRTGRATGPHLHYGVRQGSAHSDPQVFLGLRWSTMTKLLVLAGIVVGGRRLYRRMAA